jgi:hypothetical protein
MLLIRRNDGSKRKMEVPFQDSDLALDVLARSGLSLRDYSINGGKCFCTPIKPGDRIEVFHNLHSMSPGLARNLYNSNNAFRQHTRQKLAEVFQNGNSRKTKKTKKAPKKKSKKRAKKAMRFFVKA